MKKSLFLFATAALVLASCSNDVTVAENEALAETQGQEIAFAPLSNTPKRAIRRLPVEGTAFPSGQDMYVAAYDATKGADYFGQTTFDEDGSTGLWKATPKKYWPMDATTLNFLAYTGVPSGSYFNATHPAQDLTITLADNTSNQYDLMYACGRGTRARGAAASNVAMNFKHALALIKFTVKSAADYGTSLKLQSIVLDDAHYSGIYAVTHTGWDDAAAAQAVSGSWSSVSTVADVTRTPATADGWDADGNAIVTETAQPVGAGILVVPDDNDSENDYASFTINYTIDGKPYTYTHTPADLDVHQAKKYTFAITMTLNEIIIEPSVTDYVEEGSNAVTIQ